MSGAAADIMRREMPDASPQVNMAASVEKYVGRLHTLPDEAFAPLHNAWLTSLDVHSTFTPGQRLSDILVRTNPCVHLMRHARQRGVNVLGITSERQSKGRFTQPVRRQDHKFVLIDNPKRLKPGSTKAPFKMHKGDFVWYSPEEKTSVDMFHVYF
jgi:hypothetical protein